MPQQYAPGDSNNDILRKLVNNQGAIPAYPGDSDNALLRKLLLNQVSGGTGGGTVVVTGSIVLSGSGSPEGAVIAPAGSLYVDTSTGDLWVKQTGTGNTGWI